MSVFQRFSLPLLIVSLLVMIILMAAFPQASLDASVRGLAIWWDVLFPSLFPFFVISELLLGFGIVHFIGALLDPFMKPLFRVPGCGGFVAAISCASGYPIGAKLTAKLWEQKWISREEGERLVAFTTSSDPIFLIGAVSVGFFHQADVALVLGAAHYGGVLLVGLLMRFYGSAPGTESTFRNQSKQRSPLNSRSGRMREAIVAMHQARLEDGRAFGELLRQAISSSLHLIIVVGGLVVFFSVILESLTQSGLMTGIQKLVQFSLSTVGLPTALTDSIVGGIFEVTLGAKEAGAAGVALSYKVAAAAFVLSWGGLSVHAQVASILNETNLRYFPFLLARAFHAVVAALLALVLWNPLMGTTTTEQYMTVFSSFPDLSVRPDSPVSFFATSLVFILIIVFMIIASMLAAGLGRLFTRRKPPYSE